jgi:hypothetical protein
MSEFHGKPQYAPPSEVPEWFVGLVESVMLADNIGDVWDGMRGLPTPMQTWVDRVYEAHAEEDYFVDEDEDYFDDDDEDA